MTAFLGGNLRNLEDSLRFFCERLQGLGRQGKTKDEFGVLSYSAAMIHLHCLVVDAMLLWAKPTFQFVLNLQRHYADWREAWTLTGAFKTV